MKSNRSAIIETFESRTLMSVSPVLHADGDHGNTSLAAPTSLTASAKSNVVTLNWQDNSDSETGFVIYRQDSKHKSLYPVAFVGSNVTTFTDKAPDGKDVYVIRANSKTGTSAPSNAATLTVAEIKPVTAPNKLRSAAKSTTSIDLSWEGDKNATGGYLILRSSDGVNFEQVGKTAKCVRKFTDTGLTKGTFYYYKIVAIGGDGAQATSAMLTGKTKASDGPEPKGPAKSK